MTSRDRLLLSLSHREPDRIPVDLGSSTVTGISGIAWNNLRKYLNISGRTRIFDVVQQLAMVEMDIIDLFGVDVLDANRVSIENTGWYEVSLADGSPAEYPSWFRPQKNEDGSWHTYDRDGTVIAKMAAGATFFDQMHYPYEDAYPENFNGLKDALKKISWIVHSHASNLDVSELRSRLTGLREETGKALVMSGGV
ncbi:MAG TPA: methyltransferase, partial [Bacteroidales bacterium]|nr:methyltransferase [Bacteroidales bacterium]